MEGRFYLVGDVIWQDSVDGIINQILNYRQKKFDMRKGNFCGWFLKKG